MHEVLIKILDLVIRVRKWFGEQGKDILRWLISVALRALAWLEREDSPKAPTDSHATTPPLDSAAEVTAKAATKTRGKDAAKHPETGAPVPTTSQDMNLAAPMSAAAPTPAQLKISEKQTINAPSPPIPSVPQESPNAAPPTQATQFQAQPDSKDSSDETALARLMASEGRTPADKLVIGWSAFQTARARGKTLFKLLTRGKGYGPKDRRGQQGEGSLYASTATVPSDADWTLAREILSGAAKPSAAIQAHKARRWIERGQGISDEQILLRQWQWPEGIYGRITDTQFYLFGDDEPKIGGKAGINAKQLLDAVPELPAFDSAPPRSVA